MSSSASGLDVEARGVLKVLLKRISEAGSKDVVFLVSFTNDLEDLGVSEWGTLIEIWEELFRDLGDKMQYFLGKTPSDFIESLKGKKVKAEARAVEEEEGGLSRKELELSLHYVTQVFEEADVGTEHIPQAISVAEARKHLRMAIKERFGSERHSVLHA